MSNNEAVGVKRRRASGVNIWYVIGGATLIVFAAGIITSLSDIKRYMRMRSM
ncbi:MAG: hypothetical protein H7Z38_01890 [Rubrivivax sp.]|nr:hypothetical protein [Pyrinomonadaceae bacterium]